MGEIIANREIIQEIQTFVIAGKCKSVQSSTHAKAFNLDKISQSIVHEDNESCLRFANIPKMSPRTKHIALPYYLFRSKVEELEIKVLLISTHDQLADQLTKELIEVIFVKTRRELMG